MRASSRGIALLALVIAGMVLPSIPSVLASDCLHDDTSHVIVCISDWGCLINPLTPDGQYWYIESWHYTCPTSGNDYWVEHERWEYGGCCTP